MDAKLSDAQKASLLPAVQRKVLQRLRGSTTQKSQYPWDSFLPEPLEPEQARLLENASATLDPAQIRAARKAPLEALRQSHLDQLEWTDSWAAHFEAWAQSDPEGHSAATEEVDKYMGSYFKGIDKGSPAWELARTARLCAHCQLAAHIIGSIETNGSDRRLFSAGLKAQQNGHGKRSAEYTHLDHLKDLPTGKALTVSFTPRKTPEALGSPQAVYQAFFQEFSPKAEIFQQGYRDIKWSLNHSVQQALDWQAPDLGLVASRIRQKGMDPQAHFDLILASRQPEQWHQLAQSVLPAVQELLDGGRDAQILPATLFQTQYGEAVEKLIQSETIKAYREISRDSYADLTAQAFRRADPARFGNFTARDLPSLKGMSLDEGLLDATRRGVYHACAEQLAQLPGAVRRIEESYMRDRTATLQVFHAPAGVQDCFPAQAHPILGSLAPKTPVQEGPARFIPREIPLLDAPHQHGLFLSQAHFNSLCIESGKGVLPSYMVGLQGIHTTFDVNKVAQAYAHFEEQNIRRSKSFAAKICSVQDDVGTLLLPYPFRKGQAQENPAPTGEVDLQQEEPQKGIPMVRIRTNTQSPDLAKYYTPSFKALRQANPDTPVREIPLYLYAPFVSEKACAVLQSTLIQEAMQRQGKSGEVWEQFGQKALAALGFNRYQGGLDNPDLPVFAIEGEKKALAVNQMQDMAYLRALEETMSLPEPSDAFLQELKPLPMMVPVGTIGVWLTHSPSGSKEHQLRPEISETLNLRNRQFIIGHDNDGAQKVEVAASAATAAQVLKRDFGVQPFYWRPPEGPGKGFDDYVQETAKATKEGTWAQRVEQAYQQVNRDFPRQLKPLRSDILYKDIQDAQQQGSQDFQAFITGEGVQQLSLL